MKPTGKFNEGDRRPMAVEDSKICDELGLEPQEPVRLKYISGFAKMFKDHEYGKAWESEQQLKVMREYREHMASEQHKGTAEGRNL